MAMEESVDIARLLKVVHMLNNGPVNASGFRNDPQ